MKAANNTEQINLDRKLICHLKANDLTTTTTTKTETSKKEKRGCSAWYNSNKNSNKNKDRNNWNCATFTFIIQIFSLYILYNSIRRHNDVNITGIVKQKQINDDDPNMKLILIEYVVYNITYLANYTTNARCLLMSQFYYKIYVDFKLQLYNWRI